MSTMQSADFAAALARAQEWWRGAWQLFRRDATLWLGMAAIYIVVALALKLIPFLGDLVLVLLTPLPLAGSLLAARELVDAPPAPAPAASLAAQTGHYLRRPAAALGRATRNGELMLRLVLACILTLGLVMVASIVEYLLTGGSLVSGLAGARYTDAALKPVAIVGALVTVVVYAALVMALHFLVPLVTLGGREAMTALAESFALWRREARALAIFIAPFLLPLVLIAMAFGASATRWLGYLLVLTLGTVAIALFVAGSYSAYRALVPRGGAH
jgi:hypothetical protein